MAAVTDIQMYTIDGIEIPAYPTSVEPSHNLISKSWNNMYGQFQDIPVNSKLKINWKYEIISKEDLEKLWGQMIYKKILETGSRYFDITSYFPGLGFISGKFYLGTPTTFNSKDWQTINGVLNYTGLEIHWIEVDGIILNSPLTAPKV